MRAPGWVRSGGSPVPIAPRIPPAVRVGDCTWSPRGSGGPLGSLPLRLAAHPIPLPRGETEAQLGSPPLSCSLSPSLPSACLSLPTAVVTPGCTPSGSPCTDPPCMDSPQHPASHTPIAPNGMECGTPKPSLELQGSVCPLLPPPALQVLSWGLCTGTPRGSQGFGQGWGPPTALLCLTPPHPPRNRWSRIFSKLGDT